MTEKRLISSVITSGILLIILALGILVLPKVTAISFGFMICLAYIIYGGYKAINTFIMRKASHHYILDIISGLCLLIAGVLLYFAPMFNIMLVLALVGIFFLLESISSVAFALQTTNLMYFSKANYLLSLVQFAFGVCVIMILPSAAIWLVGVISGMNFLLSGIIMTNMYIGTKYTGS